VGEAVDLTGIPRYRCHKEVHAVQIARLGLRFDETQVLLEVTLFPLRDETLAGMQPLVLGAEWFWKHTPQAGGYAVFYDDGYLSYSPAAAFEHGYTRIA
jgi:hypothetical protein